MNLQSKKRSSLHRSRTSQSCLPSSQVVIKIQSFNAETARGMFQLSEWSCHVLCQVCAWGISKHIVFHLFAWGIHSHEAHESSMRLHEVHQGKSEMAEASLHPHEACMRLDSWNKRSISFCHAQTIFQTSSYAGIFYFHHSFFFISNL